jgi:hypothetical protein
VKKTEALAVLLAAVLGGVWPVAGCSESKARRAGKQLRKAIDKAQETVRQARILIEEPKGAPKQVAKRAAETADWQVLEMVGDWIEPGAGREAILVLDKPFKDSLERWGECRDGMKLIEEKQAQKDNAQASKIFNDLATKRLSDLPPVIPARLEDITSVHWAMESLKAKVVKKLEQFEGAQQAALRREFFTPIFDRLAARVLEAWVRSEPERWRVLEATDKEAREMLAGWLGDEMIREEILANVSARPSPTATTQLRDLVGARLRDQGAAKAILAMLREESLLALSPQRRIEPKALQLLQKAHEELSGALAAAKEADAASKALAQMLLARIRRQRGEYISRASQAAEARARQAIDLAIIAVYKMQVQHDQIEAHGEPASRRAEAKKNLADADEKAAASIAEEGKLEGELNKLKQDLEDWTQKADRFAKEASEAYLKSTTEETKEARAANLEKFKTTQKKANEAAHNVRVLGHHIDAKASEVDTAALRVEERQAEVNRLENVLDRIEALADANKERRDLARFRLAKLRGRLFRLINMIAGQNAEARTARRDAADLFYKAAGEFEKLGPDAVANVAMTRIRQADQEAAKVQLRQRMKALNDAVAKLVAVDDRGEEIKKLFEDKLSPYIGHIERFRGMAKGLYDKAAGECEKALASAADERQQALLDTLAAAHLGLVRMAEKRADAISAAKKSSLRDFLAPEAPGFESAHAMSTIRRLRAEIGLAPRPTLVAGAGPAAATAPAPKTPEQALRSFASALQGRDRQALLACFDASARQADAIGALFDTTVAIADFQEAMRSKYGPEAVKEAGLTLLSRQELEAIERAVPDVEGDTATIALETKPQPIRLIRKDDLWKIEASSILLFEPEGILEYTKVINEALRQAMGKIGAAGYDAERINKELEEAEREASGRIMGEMREPAEEAAEEIIEEIGEETEEGLENVTEEPEETPAEPVGP